MLRIDRPKRALGGLLLLAASAVVGCGKNGANPDGGDGMLTIPDGQVAGRRAFDVIAVLRGDGGTPLPPNNRFTMVLDTEARVAIVGGSGRGAIVGVTTSDGRTFHSAGTFSVGGDDGTACSGATEVRYESFELTLAASGLTGTASGSASISCGDCSFFVPFGATLTGTADSTRPTLRGSGFTASTPFDPVGLIASEPMPAGATARLVADDGASIDLVPSIVDGSEPLIVGFTKPAVVLRAGQGYAVTFDGLVDFAGQTDQTGPPLRLVSFPTAPLVAEDGFESATGSTLGGAMVMTGGALPAIAGNTSLYIGSAGAPGLDSTTGRSLMVRLPRQAGDTKLRFSYRVISKQAQNPFFGLLQAGSEGASATAPEYSLGDSTTITQTLTVAGQTAYAGPVTVKEVALPTDATSEVLLSIGLGGPSCGPIRFGNAGLLIDDLWLE